MKNRLLPGVFTAWAMMVFGSSAPRASADVNFYIDPAAPWQGFMNVSQLPLNGGAYVFGSAWGPADLTSSFSGGVLTLGAAPIATPDGFWYVDGVGGPGSAGNKNMDASLYVEQTGTLAGQTVTFSGEVLSNTLVDGYTSAAFIKDFAPDYSSSFTTLFLLLSPGPFSISLTTVNDPARHVQYGFTTTGPNVWPTDVALQGNVQLAAVPEPGVADLAIASVALLGVFALLRRNRIRRLPSSKTIPIDS